MELERASGILLHPTSLPGPYGFGDLGPEARRFVDMQGGLLHPQSAGGNGDSPGCLSPGKGDV